LKKPENWLRINKKAIKFSRLLQQHRQKVVDKRKVNN